MPTAQQSMSSHQALCARVAWLYYDAQMTQDQIGEALGLSRMKVNRLLSQARELGIVRITVTPPPDPYFERGNELIAAFGLRDAVVIEPPVVEPTRRAGLASAAANWLAEQLEPSSTVGVGLGRTTGQIPSYFHPPVRIGGRFITVSGAGSSAVAEFAAYNVSNKLAAASGGTVEAISAPTFVSDASVREFLLDEPSIKSSLEVARRADIVIQSVGPATNESIMHLHGTLDRDDLDELSELGAAGEAMGHFFAADGTFIPWRTSEMHIGLTLDELREIDRSVLIAGGASKVVAMLGALRGRYFNVLITDEQTAQTLLDAV